MSKIAFRTDIEGLRGIAVLLVVVYHAGVPYITGGYIGVDVFFVLSGYLITQLLVKEAEETGRIDLWNFYARRVRRLLPAVAALLIVVVGVSTLIYAPMEQSRQLSATAFATAAYASNIYFAYGSTNYLGAEAETNPLLHTWSLSVEEQFYFVWPLLIALALGAGLWRQNRSSRLSRRRLMGVMVAVCVVSLGLSVWLTGHVQPWAFFLSPARAWEFAIGALAAFVAPGILSRLGVEILGWGGVALILSSAVLYDASTAFPGFAALMPCLGTAAVLYAGKEVHDGKLAAFLSGRGLREFGRLSYSWYLWHWPVLVFAGIVFGELSLPARLACVALSLLFAEASYRLVENPVRFYPVLARRPSAALAFGLMITVGGVLGAWSWRQWSAEAARSGEQEKFLSLRYDLNATEECDSREPLDTRLKPCSFGDPDAAFQVYLVGDSHVQHWIPALELFVDRTMGGLTLLSKSSCPFVDTEIIHHILNRPFEECTEWREKVIQQMEQEVPDLIVVASSRGYVESSDASVDAAEWEQGLSSTLRRLKNTGADVVYVRDTPRPDFDVATCLARSEWSPDWLPSISCDFPKAPSLGAITALAEDAAIASVRGVGLIDVNDEICETDLCKARVEGGAVYRDSNHLSRWYTEQLAPTFVSHLTSVLAQDGRRLQDEGYMPQALPAGMRP